MVWQQHSESEYGHGMGEGCHQNLPQECWAFDREREKSKKKKKTSKPDLLLHVSGPPSSSSSSSSSIARGRKGGGEWINHSTKPLLRSLSLTLNELKLESTLGVWWDLD